MMNYQLNDLHRSNSQPTQYDLRDAEYRLDALDSQRGCWRRSWRRSVPIRWFTRTTGSVCLARKTDSKI